MSSKFLLVVLGMSADPFHYHQATPIAHLNHQPIPIALDVEYHQIVCQKISTAVALLYVLRCLPLAALDFVPPSIQRPSGIGMGLLELVEKWQAEYSHWETKGGNRKYKFPEWELQVNYQYIQLPPEKSALVTRRPLVRQGIARGGYRIPVGVYSSVAPDTNPALPHGLPQDSRRANA